MEHLKTENSISMLNRMIVELQDGESLVCHCDTFVGIIHRLHGLLQPAIDDPRWPRHYLPVALVKDIDLHEVFRLTQDGELSSSVLWLPEPARSTSVGDVVIVNDGRSHRCYLCENSGWKEISMLEITH